MPVTLNPFTGDLAVDQHDRGVLPPTAGGTTDNAIARWDGTSGVRLNNSGVTLSDADLITIPSGSSAGVVFGDADTGIYESSDDVLVFKTNATTAMSLSNVQVLSLANALPVTSGGTGVTSLTDGGILLGSGTSGVTATARPSNGELLIGSTGADPVVASLTAGTGISITPGAGSISIASTASSSWVYLTKTSASASASVTFTSTYLTSTYNKYVILLQNVIPATDAVLLYVRVSTDDGATWKSGASDYAYAGNTNSTSTVASLGNSGDTEIQLTITNMGNAAAEYTNAVIWLWDPLNASTRTGIAAQCNTHSTATAPIMTQLQGEYTTVGATNGIQFIFSSGNIASGDFIIYGVKDA